MLTVKQVYETAVKLGIASDPRGSIGVKKYLEKAEKEYNEIKPAEKEYFDQDRLFNPYSDSRVHAGDESTPVKTILAGVDIGTTEILYASQLAGEGKKVDLVIAHHPMGKSLAGLHAVMDMMIDMYEKNGIPVHVAEKMMEERMKEVSRGLHAANHFQIIDIANLLKVNLMNVHTPADNMVKEFLRKHLEKNNPYTLADMVDCILEIPEYKESKKRGVGPKIFAGSPNHRVGKFLVEMTGGTSPSSKVYRELSRVGISTIVGMHMREEATEKAVEQYLNVVIAGHISSDSLGMNLFLDNLESHGIEIIPCGGLIRVDRNKKK